MRNNNRSFACVFVLVVFRCFSAQSFPHLVAERRAENDGSGKDCTIYVSINGGQDNESCGGRNAPCATLAQGAGKAQEGDVVCVAADGGSYSCPPTGTAIVVTKSHVEIRAIGGVATIDCKGIGQAAWIANVESVILSGFEMTDGQLAGGTAGTLLSAYNTTNLRIEKCSFVAGIRSVSTGEGDENVMFTERSVNLTVSESHFVGNLRVAWASVRDVSLHITDTTFQNNTSIQGALTTSFATNVRFERCLFVNNIGCALFLSDTKNASFEGCTFQDNQEGALMFYSSADLVVKNSTFVNNTHSIGGGLFAELNPDSSATIDSCSFVNNTGGALFVGVTRSNAVLVKDSAFIGNVGQFGGVSIFAALTFEGNVTDNVCSFQGVLFRNNSSPESSGGALVIVYPPEEPFVVDPTVAYYVQPRMWNYTGNINQLYDVTFIENSVSCAGCSGGAMFIEYGQTFVHNSTFEGNRADLFGGAILVGGASTELTVFNTTFRENNASGGGSEIFSFAAGRLAIVDSSFEISEEESFFFEVPAGGEVLVTNCEVSCSTGYQFEWDYVPPFPVPISPWGLVNVTTTTMSCTPCLPGTYNLEGGGLSTEGETLAITCHPCPGFADCSRGASEVYSLPGYWCGIRDDDPSMLECTQCPYSFCYENEAHNWEEMCDLNREGVLCGECAPGYEEAFGTEKCVPEGECTAYWFVPVVLLAGFGYVGLLVLFPVTDHPLWKSIIYFLQVIPLIVTLHDRVLMGIIAFFAFDFSRLGANVGICPWTGLTGAQKIATDYMIPIILLLELALIAVLHRLIRFLPCTESLLSRWNASVVHIKSASLDSDVEFVGNEDDHRGAHLHPHSEYARHSATVAGLLLLFYEGVTSATMELLNCVSLSGGLRLYSVGEVECYTGWQYFLFVVLGLFLVPFPLALIPIRYGISSWWQNSAHAHAILEVLEEPYAVNRKWWESVGMLRRLFLLTVYVFVPLPIWRSLLLFAGCLVIFQSHVILKPFANTLYGSVEAAFLFNLVLIAALQIPHAVYEYLGVSDYGSDTYVALDVIELILIILPIAACLVVWLYLHGRSAFWRLVRRRRQDPSHSDEIPLHNLVSRQTDLTEPLIDAPGQLKVEETF